MLHVECKVERCLSRRLEPGGSYGGKLLDYFHLTFANIPAIAVNTT